MLAFVMLAVAARLLGEVEFGNFAAWLNALAILSLVVLRGQDLLITRSWNEYAVTGRNGLAMGAHRFALKEMGLAAALIGALLFAITLGQTSSPALAFVAVAFLFAQTLQSYYCNLTRSAVGLLAGDGNLELTWRALTLAGLLILLAFGWPVTSAEALGLVAGSMALSVLVAMTILRRRVPETIRRAEPVMDVAAWRQRSWRVWLSAVCSQAIYFLDVLAAWLLLGPEAAGGYFIVSRIAAILAKLEIAMSRIAGWKIAPLYYSGQLDELSAIIRKLVIYSSALTIFFLIPVIFWGRSILAIFSPEYTSQFYALLILCISGSVNALTGPTNYMLIQTGHEAFLARANALALGGKLILLAMLAPPLGTIGIALADAIVNIAAAAAMIYGCRRAVGIDPSFFGMIFPVSTVPLPDHLRDVELNRPHDSPLKPDLPPSDCLLQFRSDKRPVRLMLFQPYAENSGTQENARLLVPGFESAGMEVHQAYLFRKTPTFVDMANTYFCVEDRPRNLLAMVRAFWRLFQFIRKLGPDAVLSFQHYGGVIVAPLARLAGVRCVVNKYVLSQSLIPRPVAFADRIFGMLGLYSAVILNSRTCENEISSYPLAYRRRSTLVEDAFIPKTSSLTVGEARSAFGIPGDKKILGCVARLNRSKNQEAALRLLPHRPSWHLVLAGEGAYRRELELLALQMGCRDRLHFTGDLKPSQIGDFLRALDVFVFPSRSEMTGLAALEAADFGVPVVANRIPALQEVLSVDGCPSALFVDVNDTEEFLSAVQSVLSDDEVARELFQRSRGLAEKYSARVMVDGHLGVLKRCFI